MVRDTEMKRKNNGMLKTGESVMKRDMAKERYGVGRLARWLRHARRKARDERGAAAIELAFILPFLLILMLGAVELFLMGMAARKAARVTNTVGDLVAQAPGALSKQAINGYYNAAQYILGKFPKANMWLAIYVFGRGPKGQIQQRWNYRIGAAACAGVPTLNSDQKAAMQDGNDLVITLGCYRYPIRIGKLVFSNHTFKLKSQVVLRPRRQMTLACTAC